MQADILRENFLTFFKTKKHKIVESDSLVPGDDPTVLFTPAGMNQFKKEFLGFDSGFKRAATAQRCLRTDDLDKVGKTPGHHTFFEMLGNFSFGDYFKEEAIAYAWEFLTEELKISKERLRVSVYKDDAQAYRIWKDKIKVPENKLIKLGAQENFWPSEAKEKGPNGPCGPCSEIFFDKIELWNLVFTQFNRKDGAILEPLPKKNIDTGMGLERLTAVMQGVDSNFETELFKPIIKEIVFSLQSSVSSLNKELIYAIADHIRAIVFAIYDGALPVNESRGYVIRKLIRKSSFHLQTLGIKKPFLYTLVPVLSQIMKAPYPELGSRQENISEIILSEEKNFISTFQSCDILFKEKFAELTYKPDSEKAGRLVFQLYDTYGIPLELSRDWLNKHKLEFSQGAFKQELEAQKSRSRLQSAMKGEVFRSQHLKLKVTNTKFLGYKNYKTSAKILKLLKDDKEVKKLNLGDNAKIILDKTCFYAASGGQVGDTGKLTRGKNTFAVSDTQKIGEVVIHIGKVRQGSFKKSESVAAGIDLQRRLDIAKNHTATHLLQAALRKVLGMHIRQQGSLVAPEKLRFDFAHFKGLDKTEIDRVEELVNNFIINNYIVNVKQKSLQEAKKLGALAFFGEKYENKVRVVSIDEISSELCAGTHLNYTGQICLFKIIQEGSVASGVRRIEAVTGVFAYKIIKEHEDILADISSVLNVPTEKVTQELEKRNARIKELEKHMNSQKTDIIQNSIPELLKKAETINNIHVIMALENNRDMDTLRKAMDMVKQQISNAVIVLGSQDISRDRALLVIGITPDLLPKGLDASALMRNAANIIGGSGGGRKDFAQAGGNKPGNFSQAFEKLREIIRDLK